MIRVRPNSPARPVVAALAVAALVACLGCRAPSDDAPPAVAPPAAPEPPTVTYDDHGAPVGLHQFNPYSERLISGAQPEGEEAFRNLKALGVTTIVSVDGAKPDLELAHKYGLRYVHVPMQYSGVRPDEAAQVARAIQTTPDSGKVYVHCHHGKHRSPAAMSAACVSLGLMSAEQAIEEMKVSGTDPKYQGLFRDVANARPLSADDLARVPADLPEYVKPGDLAASMVDVDLRWEHLKAAKAVQWGVPPESPDVDPPHEARMLWELYREIARLDDATGHGPKFMTDLAEGEAAAKALEDALRAKDMSAAAAAFDRGAKACSSCHKKFRDN